jgi:hypothetical protein
MATGRRPADILAATAKKHKLLELQYVVQQLCICILVYGGSGEVRVLVLGEQKKVP